MIKTVVDSAREIKLLMRRRYWKSMWRKPDTVTGGIVFIIQQKENPKFKRKGDDLFVENSLYLTDALSGSQFVLNHLDGRQLLIKSNPGEVVKPEAYDEDEDMADMPGGGQRVQCAQE